PPWRRDPDARDRPSGRRDYVPAPGGARGGCVDGRLGDQRHLRDMTVIIDQIDTFTVRLPTRADFRWNGLDRPLGEVFIVRVTSGSVVGWGETVPLPDWGGPNGAPFGETPQIDEIVVHDLVAPTVLGQDATELGRVRA